MYALSAPGTLEEALATARMSPRSDDAIEATVVFPGRRCRRRCLPERRGDALAIRHSGQPAVEEAVCNALNPFVGDLGRVVSPGWSRVVEAG